MSWRMEDGGVLRLRGQGFFPGVSAEGETFLAGVTEVVEVCGAKVRHRRMR